MGLAELASCGASIAGVDISTRAIGACVARLPQADFEEWRGRGVAVRRCAFRSGDLPWLARTLSLDQPRALKEMRRVAKPDARFLILVPNAGFPTRRLGLSLIAALARSPSGKQSIRSPNGVRCWYLPRIRQRWRTPSPPCWTIRRPPGRGREQRGRGCWNASTGSLSPVAMRGFCKAWSADPAIRRRDAVDPGMIHPDLRQVSSPTRQASCALMPRDCHQSGRSGTMISMHMPISGALSR